MNAQIDDITLLKCLGKGAFGEVFLSVRKGKREYFATKKIDRKKADKPGIKKYFENEIHILNSIRHPNIVKLEAIRATKDNYYIVMEYINGGSLTDCLQKYKKINRRSFTEEIVQYLMRQIVDAIKYLHDRKIIHRDLKLDNIMVSFDNENDKNYVNMMKAKIKIIDFGFAIQISKNGLAYSALGSPVNMDPLILQKFSKKGGDINRLGYDSKADIWSLGTLCYEMLIGEAVFNAETMKELVRKVENGSYNVPTNLSKEIVSFLNGMLQYDGSKRLSATELAQHPFLTKRISDFSRIDLRKVSNKIDHNKIKINVKQNQTIWGIFNEDDEQKLLNIKGRRDEPNRQNEGYDPRNKRANTDKNIPKVMNNNPHVFNNNNDIHKVKSNKNQYPTFDDIGSGKNLYGQNMFPNMNLFNQGMGIRPMPQMQLGMGKMHQMNINQMFDFPTFSPMSSPSEFGFSGGIYSTNNQNDFMLNNQNKIKIVPFETRPREFDDLCCIQ